MELKFHNMQIFPNFFLLLRLFLLRLLILCLLWLLWVRVVCVLISRIHKKTLKERKTKKLRKKILSLYCLHICMVTTWIIKHVSEDDYFFLHSFHPKTMYNFLFDSCSSCLLLILLARVIIKNETKKKREVMT